ncbi:energy-coupling factor ABC transporter ATP-binding protein [Pectinatus frisingensis]|jgi:cobalt/nickel transport system ATP-binding protein|uniref:energy-coupling factor ABC transporter ATP-binding protein n=1 Tax=Pectinatus frisingensis TaxID=865 RepID=UPI0018C5B43A|nr:ABC transporter ATP-binding protein [Pectinatus frisingensis]
MTALIKLSHINYSYEKIPALHDISLEIKSGEFILLTGPNGCGKSTLFKLLNGLIFPSSGKYFFDGQPITPLSLKDNLTAKKFHKRIGYVFQNPDTQLFNPTVYDEVAFGPRQMAFTESATAARVTELLDFLKISHLKNRAPYHLSGGEKKKVSIAAVLALNPDVLMMDEPLNGLDEKSQIWIKDFISAFSAVGKTMLITNHERDLLNIKNSRIIQFNEQHQLV